MMAHTDDQHLRVLLRTALHPLQHRAFVRRCLLVLWPDSERLLLELARWLGDEVLVPGTTVPLLRASLWAGIYHWRTLRNGYDPRTWVTNIYLHFWQGAMEMGVMVMGFRGHASGGVWNPARQPFLDWRTEHPGGIEWEYYPVARPATEAERLYRLMLGRDGPKTWVTKEVIRRFSNRNGR